jgi:AcrR family transcriptional regulator
MARTQAKNYDEVRSGILDRSAGVFAAQGYAAASIADLARANGVSKGLLYHYFASKEALLDEMLNSHLDMMLDQVREAAGIGERAEDRFRSAVRRFVAINAASQSLQIVLLRDLKALGEAERAVIVEKQRRILAIVRGLIAELTGAEGAELTARTMMFVGMINYTWVWYDPDGPVGPDAYADMAAETFLKGVAGP